MTGEEIETLRGACRVFGLHTAMGYAPYGILNIAESINSHVWHVMVSYERLPGLGKYRVSLANSDDDRVLDAVHANTVEEVIEIVLKHFASMKDHE